MTLMVMAMVTGTKLMAMATAMATMKTATMAIMATTVLD